MKKIVVVQPILSHYRQSLFELLVNDPKVKFTVVAGKEFNGVKVFNSTSKKIKANLENKKISLKGRKFYYQKGLFKVMKEEKPTDVIFGGPDFHFISTIVLSLYVILFTKIRVHYWTHGISKTNSIAIKKCLSFFYKKATSILTYESDGKKSISEIIEKEKIYVVKNCLNESDYGFNKKDDNPHDKSENFTILFSGRLTRNKQVDILIKAIQILVKENIPVSCNIIGGGEEKKELENLTRDLDLTNVINFTGAIYDNELELFFHKSDVFVLPGKVGLSIIHALSYGLPVVTTSLPIHSPEVAVLQNNENAFFYNDLSSNDLAKSLKLAYERIILKNHDFKDACINSVIENGYLPNKMKESFINAIN